ncbi:glycosyltransferase family 4 protein [Roseococcus sp. SDR]|uniref:glycosyltransferase family 4 protein n=1 Tax=Roseococcus sp. SDR TaxID=2835532 RepID=UPI001BCEF88E|nr:glycosyltransferase family 4 protein [Roseococcus sp. SDR]MBS7790721.1 glycosyltransferase family 4 protein [Roseococcus sp. SDR]MBV1846035.1 glycosyltransferase family 4 protein [Roseococcus sp. SDR]
MARILYLHQHFSTPSGATATRSHAQARALAQAGHAVTLACGQWQGAVTGLEGAFRRGARQGRISGFEVLEWAIPCGNAMGEAARIGAFLRYAARATRLALRPGWDLVIASSTPLSVAIPALLARQARGTPFLFEMRDPWPELPAAMGLRRPLLLHAMERLARAACREAAAVVALTEGMAETARRRGTPPERLRVIGQGCDLDLFGPQVPPWRPDGAGSGEMLAVYAGAHGRANGLHQLLEVAALLREERRIRLLLVGEGGEKPALLAEAAARGLANLSFLDPMPKPELARLLAGSQVGLLCLAPIPAFAEWTAPNKLMDYLAAGRPVLSNVPGEAARLLEAGGCGETHAEPAAMAAALRRLAEQPTRREAMGQAARRLAERQHDRRQLATRFVTAVEGALAAAPARALA